MTNTLTKTKFTYLDYEKLSAFNTEKFNLTQPFPWCNLQGFLTDEGFARLHENFPALELFEQHTDIIRGNGQRPHNRYYLAYQSSIYHAADDSKGVVTHSELPAVWQSFVEELNNSLEYRRFMCSAFNVSDYRVRFAWHVGFNGCEVSPHVDLPDKIGTHIIYFNTSADWSEDWGGSTLVLDGKQTTVQNPDYSDFTSSTPVRIMDNYSFLFKNQPEAWHGVEPLSCPEGSYRRLFNIIFEFPPASKVEASLARLKGIVPSSLRSLTKNVVGK